MPFPLHDDRLSYVHGASDAPLIGSTIGDLFDLRWEAGKLTMSRKEQRRRKRA